MGSLIVASNMFLSFSQGTAIGKCPKDRLFREYIGLELQVSQKLQFFSNFPLKILRYTSVLLDFV